jgi:two-component system, NarL family, sensor histidine kinase DegS
MLYSLKVLCILTASSSPVVKVANDERRPLSADLLQAQDDEALRVAFNDRIIQAYEQERLRLAREIHDGPAQILANAIFELEYFEKLLEHDPGAVNGQLAQLKKDIRNGLADVRRFIFDLRPPALGEMGLFQALGRYVADYQEHFGVTVEVELPEDHDRLPAIKEVAVFRIVQEALQNIRKHARASRVVVSGRVEHTELRVTVEDNGRGFDSAEVSSRRTRTLGLTSMRERAELIEAKLRIDSSPGSGTKISLIVPLDNA